MAADQDKYPNRPPVPPPEVREAVVPYAFTVDDYHRLGEEGIIDPDARVELIEGEVLEMAPIHPPHAGTTERIAATLRAAAGDAWAVRTQNPIEFDGYNEYQPDVAVVRARRDFYRTRHPRPDETPLIVEVMESSHHRDRHLKLPVFARCGVAEVWLVDVPAQTLAVYREPRPDGYARTAVLRAGDVVAPQAFPDTELSVAELLGADA